MGHVEAICTSAKKGRVKKAVPEAIFQENYGIIGDAHAEDWHRQISLLPQESINLVKEHIPNLADGAFAENIVTSGIDFSEIEIGSIFYLGESIVMEVTQIGKECHTACAIRSLTGDCIMPREGVFSRVLKGGILRPGDTAEIGVTKIMSYEG